MVFQLDSWAGSDALGGVDHWVHDLSPFLVRFPDNPLGLEGIRYYGLSYLLAFVSLYAFLRLLDRRGRARITSDQAFSLMTSMVLGVLIGGRVGYYLLYATGDFFREPWILLRVWEGGMASHGGFLGVVAGLFWFSRKERFSPFDVADWITAIAPLGLFLGRVANFINGELWGRVTDVRWGVIFPNSPAQWAPDLGQMVIPARHPSQLYQAGLEGLLLLIYLQLRFWLGKTKPGQIAGEFLVGYGILRIVGELFREPDASLIAGMSRGQFYSILVILGGIAVIVIARKRAEKKPSKSG